MDGRVPVDELRTPEVVFRTPEVVFRTAESVFLTVEDDVPRDEEGLATLTTPEFLDVARTALPFLATDEERLADEAERTADGRVAEAVRAAAERELLVNSLEEPPRAEVACLVELRIAAEPPRTEGLVPYLLDIPPSLPLDPK